MVPNGETLKLAVIPARGGSKRIPRKNIKKFCGKPILAYSIEAAVQSRLFNEIMVSTDDDEIASIAKQYGASVPFLRSAETADDHATIIEVLLEVMERYSKAGQEFSHVCCIYPTAPFVTSEKLCGAYQLLCDTKSDMAIPMVPFSYPPLRGFVLADGHIQMKWPEYEKVRSQDLPPIYHDCGQFCFGRAEALLREKTMFCQKTVPMLMSELETQDIDNEVDWELAELKYELLKKKALI